MAITGKKNDNSDRNERAKLRRVEAKQHAKEVFIKVESTMLTRNERFRYVNIGLNSLSVILGKLRQEFKEDKFIASIAVVSEGHLRGKKSANSLKEELNIASLFYCNNSTKMAALVKQTVIGNETFYINPTYKESVDMGPPCVLLYDAKDDHRIALDIEKYAQIDICNRERAGENIRLLQTVCGGGATKGGPPFKVGVRFFRCNDNYVPIDIHGNLTIFVFRDDINWRMRPISEAAQSNSKEDSSNSNVNDVSDQAKKPAAKLAFNDDINWRMRSISEAAQSNSKEDSSNSNVNDVSDQAKKPAAKRAFNDITNYFTKS